MVEFHWAAFLPVVNPDNDARFGIVAGVNNKIRVLRRRAYGYRDWEFLKLKIISAFLPPPRNANISPHIPT